MKEGTQIAGGQASVDALRPGKASSVSAVIPRGIKGSEIGPFRLPDVLVASIERERGRTGISMAGHGVYIGSGLRIVHNGAGIAWSQVPALSVTAGNLYR